MYVTETPFGLMVADAQDAQDPRALWVELDELEQPEWASAERGEGPSPSGEGPSSVPCARQSVIVMRLPSGSWLTAAIAACVRRMQPCETAPDAVSA